MKKTLFILVLFIVVLLTGCDEKNLLSNIHGEWRVQKYAVDGRDKTLWFDTTYVNFKWTFYSNYTFAKYWNTRRTASVFVADTTQHIDTITQQPVIDHIDYSSYTQTYTIGELHQGKWLLTNSNKFIQTSDSVNGTNQYQILDHGSDDLHLLRGNEEFFLTK